MFGCRYDHKFGAAAVAGQKAFTGFIVEADLEVVALRTTWRRTQPKSLIPANHPVKKLLPLHVARVASGERLEVPGHQLGKLPAIAEAQILPQVIRAHRPARNNRGKLELERRAARCGVQQQFPETTLVFRKRRLRS